MKKRRFLAEFAPFYLRGTEGIPHFTSWVLILSTFEVFHRIPRNTPSLALLRLRWMFLAGFRLTLGTTVLVFMHCSTKSIK